MSSSNDYGLNNEQKIFIKQKVQQLGSISAVNILYHSDCSVDKYARRIALETYPHINSSIKLNELLNERLAAANKKPFPHINQSQNKVVSRSDKHVLVTVSAGKQLQNIKTLQDIINNQRIGTKIKRETSVANRKIFKKEIDRPERKKEKYEVKNNVPNTKINAFKKRHTPFERKIAKEELKRNIDIEEDSVIIRYDDPVISVGNRENAEASIRIAQRQSMREKGYGGIPEYEEGAPRSEFGTRDDFKKERKDREDR